MMDEASYRLVILKCGIPASNEKNYRQEANDNCCPDDSRFSRLRRRFKNHDSFTAMTMPMHLSGFEWQIGQS